MLIRTRIASANLILDARVPTEKIPTATHESVSFGLLPTDDRDHLDLDTGEVFQDYGYARLHKNEKKLIDASITIYPRRDDSDYQDNLMHYSGKFETDDSYHPPNIYFTVFIEPSAFRELVDNVRRSLLPETITIELEQRNQYYTAVNRDGTQTTKHALEFGWEPDGSGMIWHNKERENQRVPITSVRFDYAVLKARYDDEGELRRTLPMKVDGPADRIIEQTTLIERNLAKMLKYLGWITTIIIAFAVYFGAVILLHK